MIDDSPVEELSLERMSNKIVKFLASIKLAVVVIAAIATLIAVGTFVEAEYNTEAAQKWVYKTPWMFAVMGLLSTSLIAVMVDRWPWKRRHVSFLLAHVGILLLLVGSLITMRLGLDGSMTFGIGQRNRFVQLPETDLTIWASLDGDRFTKFKEEEVDFFLHPPGSKNYKWNITPTTDLEILEYWPYALGAIKTEASKEANAGAALRFQISNAQVNVNQWLVQKRKGEPVVHNFGPAQIYLGPAPLVPPGVNSIYITPFNDTQLKYIVYYKDKAKKPLTGLMAEGAIVQTGWMGLELKALRYLPQAEEKWHFEKLQRPTPITTGAIKLRFGQQEHMMQLNDVLKVFTENSAYIISYAQKRIDIGFTIFLKEFNMDHYQGTKRAATYQSLVNVEGPAGESQGEHLISMNEPLKHNGLTFYQASFNQDESGRPNASVLSVNYDPGRWWKYLGSLLISLGVIWLFYDKRKAASAAALKANSQSNSKATGV